MKPRLFSRLAALLVSLTAGAMSTRSGAAIIYQQNFSGTANPLNGTSVQTGTGTWIANPQFNTSGTITSTTGGGGSAVLPFTPANGNIYQLTTNITWVGNASNLNDWIGAGFANNVALDPTESTDNLNRFVGNGNNANSDIYGFTWMLHRGSGQEGYEGYANNTAWGNFNSAAVVTLPTITGGSTSTVDLKFILNTT